MSIVFKEKFVFTKFDTDESVNNYSSPRQCHLEKKESEPCIAFFVVSFNNGKGLSILLNILQKSLYFKFIRFFISKNSGFDSKYFS